MGNYQIGSGEEIISLNEVYKIFDDINATDVTKNPSGETIHLFIFIKDRIKFVLNKRHKQENDKWLKNCTFCGGEAIFCTESTFSNHSKSGACVSIKCSGCGAQKRPRKVYEVSMRVTENGIIEVDDDELSKAVDDWNNRDFQQSETTD